MEPLTFVKWGGSLITDKATPYTIRQDVLARLAEELGEFWREHPGALVLGHGSGSFGHQAATETGLAGEGLPQEQVPEALSRTQHAAGELHREVVRALRHEGLPAVSYRPSSAMIAERGAPADVFTEPLQQVLQLQALPVTCGDVLLDRGQGASISSTETIFQYLINMLGTRGIPTRRVVWMGDTDGIYDADGNTISRIEGAKTLAVSHSLGLPRGADVTGGMQHRLDVATTLAQKGVRSILANGLVPGRMLQLLRHDAAEGITTINPIDE